MKVAEKKRTEKQKRPAPRDLRRISARKMLLAAAIVLGCLVAGYLAYEGLTNARAANPRLTLENIPFNGARAYEDLKQLCDEIGPRCTGSVGMTRQQAMLKAHFEKCGGRVELQQFENPHPLTGEPVPIVNMIVHWRPQSEERILLCTHYDTLPFPVLDPVDPKGRFVGANDGGSGVAVLMELGREMRDLEPDLPYGVDFVFFDAEEFMFDEHGTASDPDGKMTGEFFVGSEYFARQYRDHPPPYRYRWGVLLDMIGDKDLRIPQERIGLKTLKGRKLVRQIWETARRLGVREFVMRPGIEIKDDHVPLNKIARITTIDLIDFDYPAWHTRNDTPEQCSALSLAKVGWVLREWLKVVE